MFRSLLPFILASLGFTLVALAINMPLFEWQISEIVTDLPPEVDFNPSPWTTMLGEALDDDSYIKVNILNGIVPCRPEGLTSVVRRSQNDEILERTMLNLNQTIIRALSTRSTFGVVLFLCGIYIWWFTIWYNRPFSETVISTVIAVILLGVLINVWRVFLPRIGVVECLGLYGRVTLNASLSKVHYETLIVLFASIFAELGTVGVMLRQVIKAASQAEESSRSVMG